MFERQQRHHRDVVACSGQKSYCSRSSQETLASCFDLPGTDASASMGVCGQMISGPVDVEDLGSFCTFSNQPQICLTTPQFNCCDYGQQQPVQIQMPEVNGSYYGAMSVEEAAIAYCTDSRWMACPATSYCPLYDVSQQPLESWQALPCAEDFCAYYAAEDDMLEEYLYVVDIRVFGP